LVQSGVGEALRRIRVERQLALEEISRATKISTRFLHAIETEDFDSLPGLIFTRNFVRQYATFMEMDPEPLLAMIPRFDLESAPMTQPPNRPRRPLWDPRWNSALASIAWTVLACGAAVAAYAHFNRPTESVVENVKAAMQQPAPKTAPATSLPPVESLAPATPQLASPDAATAQYPVQVVVAAKEESWVQASADGKSVFTGMLKPGESKAIGAGELVKLRTGNAGGIEISLNGRALDPLGPSGQIRSVTLTAAGPQLPQAATVAAPPLESSPF